MAVLCLNDKELILIADFQRELKSKFKVHYEREEIELALLELKELNDQVILGEHEEVVIYPEQFYEGI